MTLSEVAAAAACYAEPAVMLVAQDGAAAVCALGDRHPAAILAELPAEAGAQWWAVAFIVHGHARNLETGEDRGRVTVAVVVSRDDMACRLMTPEGVSEEPPGGGALVDAARAFLAA